MFSPPHPHRQQILRLPQSFSPQSPLRMCTSQELPKQHARQPYPPSHARQKISIKQFLSKRNMQAQSCASLSQASQRPLQEEPRSFVSESRKSPVSLLRSPQKVPTVQNNNAFNYIFGECVIKPQQVRIIYHNNPSQKIIDPPSPNKLAFKHSQLPQNQASVVSSPPKAKEILQTQPSQLPAEPQAVPLMPKQQQGTIKKQETFNQFMSFGPKHFDLFKNMEALQINEITSHILEETERTDLDAQSHNEKKRLTKTFSEMKFRKEREKYAVVSQLEGRTPFARSNFFRSIKKTETMGGREESSDHESEVVEKFESLMQKVRENRLDNSIVDI